MDLVFSKSADKASYPKIGEESETSKHVWVFPDIRESFPPVKYNNKVIIDPHRYYITSGEALRKTEVLISDIRELLDKHSDNEKILTDLSNLLLSIDQFYTLLIETKGQSKYLEVTKSEDGIYSGNICARKDPKKRKQK